MEQQQTNSNITQATTPQSSTTNQTPAEKFTDQPILPAEEDEKSKEALLEEKIEILKKTVLKERFLRIKQLQNNNHFIRELLNMSLAQTKSFEKELISVKAQNKALKAELSKNGLHVLHERIAEVFEKNKGKKNAIQSIIQEGTDKAISELHDACAQLNIKYQDKEKELVESEMALSVAKQEIEKIEGKAKENAELKNSLEAKQQTITQLENEKKDLETRLKELEENFSKKNSAAEKEKKEFENNLQRFSNKYVRTKMLLDKTILLQTTFDPLRKPSKKENTPGHEVKLLFHNDTTMRRLLACEVVKSVTNPQKYFFYVVDKIVQKPSGFDIISREQTFQYETENEDDVEKFVQKMEKMKMYCEEEEEEDEEKKKFENNF